MPKIVFAKYCCQIHINVFAKCTLVVWLVFFAQTVFINFKTFKKKISKRLRNTCTKISKCYIYNVRLYTLYKLSKDLKYVLWMGPRMYHACMCHACMYVCMLFKVFVLLIHVHCTVYKFYFKYRIPKYRILIQPVSKTYRIPGMLNYMLQVHFFEKNFELEFFLIYDK